MDYGDTALNSLSHDRDTGDSGNSIYTSTYNLSAASGTLTSVTIVDGRSRTVSFKTDMGGQVIRRDEADGNGSNGDPHEVWYRFNGREMAMTGNNGNMDFGYDTSIAKRTATPPSTPGAFRFGATSSTTEVDMHNGMDAINSFRQGSAGGQHIVEAGETLQSIALAVWGDADLWYKLAEANDFCRKPGDG